MAAILYGKYGTGDGGFQVDIDTSNVTNPHTTKPIVRVVFNKAAYDALAAAGKTDIDNVTMANLIAQAFSQENLWLRISTLCIWGAQGG